MAFSADLGKKLEAVVNDLVAEGRYNSKSEVLREGVRLVEEREAALMRLYALLEKAIQDVKKGPARTTQEVFVELRTKFNTIAEETGAADFDRLLFGSAKLVSLPDI